MVLFGGFVHPKPRLIPVNGIRHSSFCELAGPTLRHRMQTRTATVDKLALSSLFVNRLEDTRTLPGLLKGHLDPAEPA